MNSRYLYLDESGDGGWTPKFGGNSSEPYFVYAGAILTPSQNHELKRSIDEILDSYFDKGKPEEIHYADICQGNKEYKQLTEENRGSLRDNIFEAILEIEPTLMATVIDKNRLKYKYKNNALPPKSLAFRATVDRFHKHLKSNGCIGNVVIDAGESSIDRELRNLIYDAKEDGIKLPGVRNDADTTLPRLMDTVNVTPSEMSPGIQLADVIAYQVRHEYRYPDTSHGFNAIEHLFRDPDEASLTEPSLVPA